MKKLKLISIIVLVITVIVLILWRFFVSFPDWSVRVFGIIMLASIFTTIFSTVNIANNKK